jgi:hypothetical protein
LSSRKLMETVFWDRTGKERWWWNSCNKRLQNFRILLRNTKKFS